MHISAILNEVIQLLKGPFLFAKMKWNLTTDWKTLPLFLSSFRFPSANFEVDSSFAGGGGGEVNSLKPFGAAEQKASERVGMVDTSLRLSLWTSG